MFASLSFLRLKTARQIAKSSLQYQEKGVNRAGWQISRTATLLTAGILAACAALCLAELPVCS